MGVIVDDELKFHKQTAAAVKKANTILGLARKSFAVLDSNTVPVLYKSIVRPYLEYGNVIWGPFFKNDITAVEKVQRRATKVVPELKDHPYDTRLCALKLPSLLHRRSKGYMIYTYKIITDKMNIHKEDLFQMSHLRTQGHQFKFFKKHAKRLTRINTFSRRIVNDWNGLSPDIVNVPSIIFFKSKLDRHWMDKLYGTHF